jgi:hypothetical protein
MTEPTMSNAATTSSSVAPSTSPQTAPATADALYGNTQQAQTDQKQQVAEPTAVAKDAGNQPEQTDAAKPADVKAPAQYEFKTPDGAGFDPEVVTAFSEVARELDLTQEAAQKVLDRMSPKIVERQMAQIEAVRTQWTEASKGDKEFGGDKLSENLAVAKKALDSFGTSELRALLNESGLGNHPEIIRFMFRAGRSLSEDRYVGSSTSNNPSRETPRDFNSVAAALYSNQS